MTGAVIQLLDRGWDAQWVHGQPLYVLVRFVDTLSDAAKVKAGAANADGSGSRTFVVDNEARKKRQAARDAARALKEAAVSDNKDEAL